MCLNVAEKKKKGSGKKTMYLNVGGKKQKNGPKKKKKTMYLNVGRFWLLKLEVPVLVSRYAVPQSARQGQTASLTINIIILDGRREG